MTYTTIIAQAATNSPTLKSSIPMPICKQFDIKKGDILKWYIFVKSDGTLGIKVVPQK